MRSQAREMRDWTALGGVRYLKSAANTPAPPIGRNEVCDII